MESAQQVSGPNDNLPIMDGDKIVKSSTKNSSSQNSENDSGSDVNNMNEFQKNDIPSSEKFNSELREEQMLKKESVSQNVSEEIISAESSQNNSLQEKSISVKSTFSFADITPDDEIYTLQFPRNYNKQDLCNINIDFSNFNTSITSRGEIFKVELLNSEKEFITLAVPKSTSGGSLIKLPFKGHLVIQKSVNIEDVEPMVEDAFDKDTVAFPDDIKIRHPLLGIDWEAHAELACFAYTRDSLSKKSKIQKRGKIKCEDLDEPETKKLKREIKTEVVSHKKNLFNYN